MVMRYHPGLAVGHIYAHGQFPSETSASRQVEESVVDSDNDEPSGHEENIVLANGESEYSLQDDWESIDEDADSIDHRCDHYLSDESDELWYIPAFWCHLLLTNTFWFLS
jgi:hypothetical protein